MTVLKRYILFYRNYIASCVSLHTHSVDSSVDLASGTETSDTVNMSSCSYGHLGSLGCIGRIKIAHIYSHTF